MFMYCSLLSVCAPAQFSGDGCGILLTLLWYLSVLYSMVVVAMLYTYQFDYIETYWNRSVSEDW